MIEALLRRPLTLVRTVDTGGTDDYGNPVPSSTTAELVYGYMQQAARSELQNDRDVETEQALVVLPAGVNVDALVQVVADGIVWQVDGPPWSVRVPTDNREHHVELTARRAR